MTPMLCARWLRRGGHAGGTGGRDSRPEPWARSVCCTGAMRRSLGWSLKHPALLLIVVALTVAANIWLYRGSTEGASSRSGTRG